MSQTKRLVAIAIGVAAFLAATLRALGDLGVPISTVKPLNTNAATDGNSDDGLIGLATNGKGNWVCAWSAGGSAGNPLGMDEDILVARSIDNGANWSSPVPLNANAATDDGNDDNVRIATDRQGHWVAVWSSASTLGNTIGADYDIFVARSIDNGANWSIPVPLNNNAATDTGQDGNPEIATDGQGHWVVVWSSSDSLGNTIGTDHDVLVARSVDNGANWSNPAPLNSNAATDSGVDYNPVVTTDRQGHWVTVWYSNDTLGGTTGTDSDIHFARSVDNGANWSLVAPLNTNAATDTGDDSEPRVATDEQGNWVAVWTSDDDLGDTIGTDYDIFMARSKDNGATWSDPAPLNNDAATDSGGDGSVSLAVDRLGDWVAIWESSNPPTGTVDDEWDVRVARSIDAGGHWSNPVPLNSNAAADSGNDYYSRIVTDGRGSWIAVWEGEDPLGNTIGGDWDILMARFALPDCNSNLIGDPLETASFLAPDLNFNSIPDTCELPFEVPLPGQPGGCGVGLCGTGAMMFAPLTVMGFVVVGRTFRRRTRGAVDTQRKETP